MTYEYACEVCGHMWEADQSIKDDPLKKCPSCGKDKAKRQVSGGAGFILKGGGWYADGYASGSNPPKGGDSSSDSSSSTSTSKAPAKSESKSSSDSGSSDKKSSGGGSAGTSKA